MAFGQAPSNSNRNVYTPQTNGYINNPAQAVFPYRAGDGGQDETDGPHNRTEPVYQDGYYSGGSGPGSQLGEGVGSRPYNPTPSPHSAAARFDGHRQHRPQDLYVNTDNRQSYGNGNGNSNGYPTPVYQYSGPPTAAPSLRKSHSMSSFIGDASDRVSYVGKSPALPIVAGLGAVLHKQIQQKEKKGKASIAKSVTSGGIGWGLARFLQKGIFGDSDNNSSKSKSLSRKNSQSSAGYSAPPEPPVRSTFPSVAAALAVGAMFWKYNQDKKELKKKQEEQERKKKEKAKRQKEKDEKEKREKQERAEDAAIAREAEMRRYNSRSSRASTSSRSRSRFSVVRQMLTGGSGGGSDRSRDRDRDWDRERGRGSRDTELVSRRRSQPERLAIEPAPRRSASVPRRRRDRDDRRDDDSLDDYSDDEYARRHPRCTDECAVAGCRFTPARLRIEARPREEPTLHDLIRSQDYGRNGSARGRERERERVLVHDRAQSQSRSRSQWEYET